MDPLGEKGGRNLYAVLGNACLGRVDVLGQGEFEWRPEMEVSGPPDEEHPPGGTTDWAYFRPEASVVNPGCCYHVELDGGFAQAVILYVPGVIRGEDVLGHEKRHVDFHFKPSYEDYKTEASRLGMACMNKVRAVCIRSVILSELSREYRFRAHFLGLTSDVTSYMWELQNPEKLLEMWLTAARMYSEAQEATRAAVAACSNQ